MKRLSLYLAIISLSFITCEQNQSQSKNDTPPAEEAELKEEIPFDDNIAVPEGFSELQAAKGDLNGDGIEERVIVYNMGSVEDMEAKREVRIFRKGKTNWKVWHKTIGGVLSGNEGGVFGDPFNEIKIEGGLLRISHFGGSRIKWAYDHHYQYQNDSWKLVRAVSQDLTPCEYNNTNTYDFVAGKIVRVEEILDCAGDAEKVTNSDKKEYNHTFDQTYSLDGFVVGEHKAVGGELDTNSSFYF